MQGTANEQHRRVLVCVTGLSPQVVTETIFALAQQNSPWIPTEVHVLTTTEGARMLRQLLPGGGDQLGKLQQQYNLPAIAFDESHIHVPADADGTPLQDIRTPADNLAMADAIVTAIAGFTQDTDTAVHVSLAGGRKSMGFFAGYALSLYGRLQDHLSHVLVSRGFETHPEFYFPPNPPQHLIDSRSGQTLDTTQAVVELADIPFVRLRPYLPSKLRQGGRFAEVVAAIQRLQGPPSLQLIPSNYAIVCGGQKISLTPTNYALYSWLAKRRAALPDPDVVLHEFDANGSNLRRELHEHGCVLFPNKYSTNGEAWRDLALGCDGEFIRWISPVRTRVNEEIENHLGLAGVDIYGIHSRALKGRSSKYALNLPPEVIEWREA